MMALSRHSEWMGVTPERIHATGGAAENREILQVMADVFGAPVHWFPAPDAAALGAALRAWEADTSLPWTEIVSAFATPSHDSHVRPVAANVTTYRLMRPRFEELERRALSDARGLRG